MLLDENQELRLNAGRFFPFFVFFPPCQVVVERVRPARLVPLGVAAHEAPVLLGEAAVLGLQAAPGLEEGKGGNRVSSPTFFCARMSCVLGA